MPVGVAGEAAARRGAVHRIVQEGLTNARKHAHGATTTVVLDRDGDGVAVTVRNAAEGVFGSRLQAFGRAATRWLLPATVIAYAIVLLVAQVRLDALSRILHG